MTDQTPELCCYRCGRTVEAGSPDAEMWASYLGAEADAGRIGDLCPECITDREKARLISRMLGDGTPARIVVRGDHLT